MRISLCMIAKNEESNLPDLLRSASPLGAHVVVVDTGSTDRTREIVRQAGADLVEWAWRNDFAAARNVSLDHAKAPWVLWLDADDRLPPESIPRILEIAEGAPDRAVSFLVKNTTDDGSTGSEFSQIRMFPNHPRIRFHGAIHEQVYPGLAALGMGIDYTSILVHHTGYTDPATIRAKQVRNHEILKERVKNSEAGAIQWYQLATMRQDLGDLPGAEEAFRRTMDLLRAGDADQHLSSVLPCHLASLRLAQNDQEGAFRVYQETLDPDPATWHPNQTSLVAELWERVEGIDAALEFWEKAFTPSVRQALLPVDPKLVSIRPLQTLAEYWKGRGNEPLAIELLKLLKEVLQDGRPARSRLPDAYLRHGLAARATELYAWCLEKDGETPEVWESLVRALVADHQIERAEEFRLAGRAKWPGHSW